MKRIDAARPALLLLLTLSAPLRAEPLSLGECIRLAWKNSPLVGASAAQREQAEQARKQGLAPFSPKAELEFAQAALGYDETGKVNRGGSFNEDTYRSGLQASWNLFNSGKDAASYRQRRHESAAAADSLAAERDRLALAVAQAYFRFLLARRSLAVQAANVKARREHLETATKLFRAAARSYSDVLQAQLVLRDAEISEAQAESDVELEAGRLALLLGLPPDSPLEVREAGEARELGLRMDEALAAARGKKPEVLALEGRSRALREASRRAFLEALPSLTLDGGYFLQLDQAKTEFAPTQTVAAPNPYWRVDLALRIPIWDGLFRFRDSNRADSAWKESRLRLDQARRDAAAEAFEAYLAAERNLRVHELTKAQFETARQSVKLLRERYQLGSASFLEVLDGQSALQRLELASALSLYQFHIARLALRRAMGAPVEDS